MGAASAWYAKIVRNRNFQWHVGHGVAVGPLFADQIGNNCRRRRTREPGGKRSEQGREQTTNSTHLESTLELESGILVWCNTPARVIGLK